MNHEHEQSRTGSTSAEFAHFHDDTVEPGQSSRSAGLRKPGHAVASGLVQRDARGGSAGAAAADKTAGRPASEQQRFAVATSGAASETPFRAEMERGFGTDFSNVRAHVGGAQAEIGLRGLGADGAAQGSTVVFASSSPSRELVAHELAHVVQNRNGGVAENAEAAADAAAATVASGGRATVDGGPGFAIQRHDNHAASAARVSYFIAQAVEAGDNARLERIASVLNAANQSAWLDDEQRAWLDDDAAHWSSTSEVTVRLEGEDLCLAREDLPTVLHELAAARQVMAPVAPPARPLRSEASLRSEAPLRSEVPPRSEAPTPAPPTPAPMSGQPAPALATGEPVSVTLSPEEAQRRCEANDLRVMIFPFRGTRFGAAPISAHRDGDSIVVRQPVHVFANSDFRQQTRTLPIETFTGGVRLRPDQMVRVHIYEPRWYHLNITGATSGDQEREFCVTGEQMLQIAEASTNATLLNIGLTGVDAATLFVPVGEIASVVGRPLARAARPLARGARTLTAAAMIGIADAAPPALGGTAATAAVTVVEEQTVTRVAGQAIAQSVSQTATSTAMTATGSAATAALPQAAGAGALDIATHGGLAVGADLAVGSARLGEAARAAEGEAARAAEGEAARAAEGEAARAAEGEAARAAEGTPGLRWENPLSTPTYGHSFLRHGARQTRTQLTDRARSLGHQVGQWTDDRAAAEFIARVAREGPGVHDVSLPPSLGRGFLPNGTEIAPDMARIIVKQDGAVRTAFPFSSHFPTT
jgi:hypothetical protein